MSRFYVGDVCIIVSSPCMSPKGQKLVGRECTVHAVFEDADVLHLLHKHERVVSRIYAVEIDGTGCTICSNCLQLKHSPAAEKQQQALRWQEKRRGSFQLIGQITGWTPPSPVRS